MRLTRLTLANYGPFQSRRIEFDPAPGRINLLIAPNGAGKSVLRGAFCDLLFSIHPQTKMDFRFGKSGMRLMADAVGQDGAAFSFSRRKGMGNTLIDADGAPLDAALLARLLDQTDKTLLERLFALDTERLRNGGTSCWRAVARSPTRCSRRPAGCGRPVSCAPRWTARATRWRRNARPRPGRSIRRSTSSSMRGVGLRGRC